MTTTTKSRSPVWMTLLRVSLPLLAIGGGLWWARDLMVTAPKAETRERGGRSGLLVEVTTPTRGRQVVRVQAMGTVKPAREVAVHPRVTGMVRAIAPDLRPGGVFPAGAPMLWLEEDDLKLAVEQKEAAVAVARGEMEIERGQQAIARDELALIREPLGEEDKKWVLREPQMQGAAARLQSAEAALAQARLDLARTTLSAPFNAVVLSHAAESGSQVGPSSVVASLAGTDVFWIELAVPGDDLKWIRLPSADGAGGSTVRVVDEVAWPENTSRDGRVIGLAANLDPDSRMARVLVAVEDPLSLRAESAKLPRLLLNGFVRAEIDGLEIPDAVRLSRSLLRRGNTVWLMDANDALEIRDVEVAYGGENEVIITGGLGDGDRVVATNLRTPVPGMALRTESPRPAAKGNPEPKVAGPAAP